MAAQRFAVRGACYIAAEVLEKNYEQLREN